MLREIREQPESLGRILDDVRPRIKAMARAAWNTHHPSTFFITGCGSSYYAAMIPAHYYNYSLGLDGRAIPSSEFVWYAPGPESCSSILVSLSRSGKTSESVEAVRKAVKVGMPSIAVTSDSGSTMSEECDYSLDTGVSSEQSVIMTKTFTGGALSTTLLGIEFRKAQGGSPIPEQLEDALGNLPRDLESVMSAVDDQVKSRAESAQASRFIYLGSGANYASCLEGALKLRETSYVASECYHTMEFRHGPFAELEKGIQVISVVPNDAHVKEQLTLLKEIASTGATVVPISNEPEVIETYENSIVMPDSIRSELAPILYMIPMQLFAYYYAVKKGRNPDTPRNLTKFVTTEIKPTTT
jgi:glucosamine--fructose-6-phosphate aminotransferase (isomerizing)